MRWFCARSPVVSLFGSPFWSLVVPLVVSLVAGLSGPLMLVTAISAQAPGVTWTPQASGVTVRLRGVSAVSSEVAWASGAQGTVLRTADGGRTWRRLTVPGADTLDFRDVDALDARTAVVLSIGSGEASRIYRTEDAGVTWSERFRNRDEGAFFDAITFGTATHGVAVSDSVDGRFVILLTSDGGRTWNPAPAAGLPPARPGEGAFAASGSNVAMVGATHIWFATTKARVLRSTDGGRRWTVHDAPIATGDATGIFSVAFRDARHGVVVGGNYTVEQGRGANVAVTSNGGITWTGARGDGVAGFRSAVTSISTLALTWLTVGPAGADWSPDDGQTWAPAGGDGYDAVSLVRREGVGWATGAGGRIARVTVTRPGAAAPVTKKPGIGPGQL